MRLTQQVAQNTAAQRALLSQQTEILSMGGTQTGVMAHGADGVFRFQMADFTIHGVKPPLRVTAQGWRSGSLKKNFHRHRGISCLDMA